MRRIIALLGNEGSGKSVLTVLLARSAARTIKRPTVVMDMAMGKRDLPILFGVEDQVIYDICDVIVGNCDLQQSKLPIEENLVLIAASIKKDKALLDLNSFQKLVDDLEEKAIVFMDGFADLALLQGCTDLLWVDDGTSIRPETADAIQGFAGTKYVLQNKTVRRKPNKKQYELYRSNGLDMVGVVPYEEELADAFDKAPLSVGERPDLDQIMARIDNHQPMDISQSSFIRNLFNR